MTKQISVVDILKQSSKFNLVNIIANILSIPKSLIIAMVLVPKDYGIISFLGLWPMYAEFINPGFLSASSREMTYFIGINNEKEAIRIQNISHTSDFLYSLIPFTVILSASFFFSERVMKTGFVIAALAYFLGHILVYWRGVNFVRQHFNLAAKGDLIKSVAMFLVVLAFIFRFKIYAVLAAPIIGALCAGIYYFKKGRIGYKFTIDKQETYRLFKVGISFSMLSLAYWGYRLIDKTLIAAFLSMSDLGIYSYASVYIFLGLGFLSDFGNVLAPVLWTKVSRLENRADIFYDTKRIIVYLSIVTAIMTPLLQVCFYFLVQFFTKKFIVSIPIFIVLSCNLYLVTLVMVPILILQSAVVNKQVLSLKAYIAGLILNIIFDIFAIRMGYGILSISLITVAVQSLVTFTHLFLVRRYIFSKDREFPFFVLYISILFFVSIGFGLFHNYLLNKIANPWLFGIISLPIQVIAWSIIIGVFYRQYFSKDKASKVVKLVKDFFISFQGKIVNQEL